MRISTSTCSHEKVLWGTDVTYTCEDSLRACRKAGFKVMDMNFATYSRNALPMTRPDWADWCVRQKALADELGIELSQAHAHFFALNEQGNESEEDAELIRRSIIGAGLMGIKWMVFHPYSLRDGIWYSYKDSKRRNMELFREYAELCAKQNVSIALENMIESENRGRRYCSSTEELIDLHDSLNDPIFGICWDFGHANLAQIDQCAALRQIGKRLKVLHVDDNRGKKDDHLAPYFGTIVWEPIMKTLKEIGYDGDFTYEIFNFHNGLPDAMQEKTLRYTYELAEYMLSLAK